MTDLKTQTGKTTNDEKLQKTLCLVSLARQTPEKEPDEYKEHHKHLCTRFVGIVFYDDKIVTPHALRRTVITLLHKGHPATNKMSAAAKPF